MKTTDKFNKYIQMISGSFNKYINNSSKLNLLEEERKIKIRNGIILLVKLYNDIPVEEKKIDLLKHYFIKYDYHVELEKCIIALTYQINEETIKQFIPYNESNNYIKYLKQYNQDILHSLTHNHDISIIDVSTNECIKPKIDFDLECFTLDMLVKKKKRQNNV